MIRYVRVQHEDELEDDNWFSFYCTIMDGFVTFSECQIFRNVDDFKDCYYNRNTTDGNRPLERFLKLIPNPTTNTGDKLEL